MYHSTGKELEECLMSKLCFEMFMQARWQRGAGGLGGFSPQ